MHPSLPPVRRRAAVLVAALVLLVTSALGVRAARSKPPAPAISGAAAPLHGADGDMPRMAGGEGMGGMVVVPARPTDGVLTIVISPGTDAAMKRSGNAGYRLPDGRRLEVGDAIVIRNAAPHMILYAFLLPGQTVRRTLTQPGSETYSSGCAANAAAFHDFMTIFAAAR